MWKKLLLAVGALATTVLGACVAVPVEEHRGHGYYYHDGYYGDRDHDGVPNGRDRYPDNPYRR